MSTLSRINPNNQPLPENLKRLNTEMMAPDGPKFRYVNAVRNGQKFRVCIMREMKYRYIATTTTRNKFKPLVLRAYGVQPSDAFMLLTKQIEFNLRQPDEFYKQLFPKMETAR